MSRVRTWTDRSGSFKVEAEFIGLKDSKIHLHKLNGVKIAVPVNKMSVEDLEYVERATGVSLDEDKPLSDIKRRSTQKAKDRQSAAASRSGASVQKDPEYDWFDFFLQCGCNPQVCERYARAFSQDQMGEEILPDVGPALLRTLGIKEGDILRIMKNLDARYNRTRAVTDGKAAEESAPSTDADGAAGGLFSGPGGALRNNTRKGRPAPAVQTNDIIDADAFKPKDAERRTPSDAAATPLTAAPARQPQSTGFDDDAWDLQPSKSPAPSAPAPPPKTESPAPQPQTAPPPPVQKPLPTGGMAELSLLSPPLQPNSAPPPQTTAQPQSPTRPTADASFFDKLGAPAPVQALSNQPTGRARPMAPQQTGMGSTIAPPPARAASAPGFPQNQQQSQFAPPPMTPQYTGMPSGGYQAPQGQSLQDLQQQRMMTGYQPQQQFTNGMPIQQTGFQPQYQQPSFQQQMVQGQMTGSPFADPPRAPFTPTPSNLQQSFAPPPQQTSFMQPMSTGLPPPLTPAKTGNFAPQMNGGFQQQQVPQQQYPMQTGFGQHQQQPQQTGFAMPPQQQPPPNLQLQTGAPGGYSMSPLNPTPTGFGNSPAGFNQFGGQQQQQQQQQQNGFMQPQQTGFGAPQPLVPQQTGPAPNIRFGVQPGGAAPRPLTPQMTGRRANLANASAANPFGF